MQQQVDLCGVDGPIDEDARIYRMASPTAGTVGSHARVARLDMQGDVTRRWYYGKVIRVMGMVAQSKVGRDCRN